MRPTPITDRHCHGCECAQTPCECANLLRRMERLKDRNKEWADNAEERLRELREAK